MAIKLSKGTRINISKNSPKLSKLMLGLGWVPRKTDGVKFDLDVSVLMLDKDGNHSGEKSFIFYHNPKSECGSLVYNGDNQVGSNEGDAETVSIQLDTLPETAEKLVVVVTIDEAEARQQNFGQVDDSYIRLLNQDTGEEVAKYDLAEEFSTETCVIFAEVYKKDGEWRAVAKGDGYAGGLGAFLESYGFQVD